MGDGPFEGNFASLESPIAKKEGFGNEHKNF